MEEQQQWKPKINSIFKRCELLKSTTANEYVSVFLVKAPSAN